jgi:large subunit ribosomal protein L24
MNRIKKDDLVQVIKGEDRGKRGRVIAISIKKDKVVVEGVAVRTRHIKARRQGESSAIRKEEAFIAISNVMPVCPVSSKPTRVRTQIIENGKRVRVSSRSNQAI